MASVVKCCTESSEMNHPLLETNLNFDEYLIKAGRRPLSSSGRGVKECDSSEVLNDFPPMS